MRSRYCWQLGQSGASGVFIFPFSLAWCASWRCRWEAAVHARYRRGATPAEGASRSQWRSQGTATAVALLLLAGCAKPAAQLDKAPYAEFCRDVPVEDTGAREDCADEWYRRNG